MMRRSSILVLTSIILLLCTAAHGHEQAPELEERVTSIEEGTTALQKRIRTHETDDNCARHNETRTWEQFFNELDRHNGDQSL